jgi:hypothetical protein
MDAASITPSGVRDGEAGALRGLVAARGPAVLAFCTSVCGPDAAPRAAAEAFARLRAALADAPSPESVDMDDLLRGGTRHAAASMIQVPEAPTGIRLHHRDSGACRHVPALLAARAGGVLGLADQERLARHLDRCERCRRFDAGFSRAERDYDSPPAKELPAAVATLLVAALEAAAPVVATERVSAVAAQATAPAAAMAPSVAVNPPADDGGRSDPAVDDDVLGATVEWDALPRVPAQAAAPLVRSPQHELLAGGRERRGRGGRITRLVLPFVVVLAAGIGALAVAGVFGGDDPTPPAQRDAGRLEQPVTTPLPLDVGTTAGESADGMVTAPLQP